MAREFVERKRKARSPSGEGAEARVAHEFVERRRKARVAREFMEQRRKSREDIVPAVAVTSSSSNEWQHRATEGPCSSRDEQQQ